MLSKGVEFNVPIWVLMIDLKETFDRVDHKTLFHALRHHMDSDNGKLYKTIGITNAGSNILVHLCDICWACHQTPEL